MTSQHSRPPGEKRPRVAAASVLGMDADARSALKSLAALAETGRTAIAGAFMPDRGISSLLASLGIEENIRPEESHAFRHIVIPYTGMTAGERETWKNAGVSPVDFTSPQIRRAQTALGLARLEGARGIVIGRHDDEETRTLVSCAKGTVVIEDTTDTARLPFAPAFGVVCQTTLSPRKADWLFQQFRMRWRDAHVSFINTISSSMKARDEALENRIPSCDSVLIAGNETEASVLALAETAARRDKPFHIISSPEQLAGISFSGAEKILLTAGAFARDETIRAIAATLVRTADAG